MESLHCKSWTDSSFLLILFVLVRTRVGLSMDHHCGDSNEYSVWQLHTRIIRRMDLSYLLWWKLKWKMKKRKKLCLKVMMPTLQKRPKFCMKMAESWPFMDRFPPNHHRISFLARETHSMKSKRKKEINWRN